MLYYNPDRHFYTFKLIYSPANELLVVVQKERKVVENVKQEVRSGGLIIVGRATDGVGSSLIQLVSSKPVDGLSIIESSNPSVSMGVGLLPMIMVYLEGSDQIGSTVTYCDQYHTPLITTVDIAAHVTDRQFPTIYLAQWELAMLSRINKIKIGFAMYALQMSIRQNQSPQQVLATKYDLDECADGLLVLRDLIIQERVSGKMFRGYHRYHNIIPIIAPL